MIPNKITIHCSATENNKELRSSVIAGWHKARGFDKIGYHLVIQPSGEVETGRALNEIGAHVLGENDGNIGICLIGNDKFTIKQFDVLRYQIDGIRIIYNIKPWEIWVHNQFRTAIEQKKTCPNITINKILAWYIGQDQNAIEQNLIKRSLL